MAPKKKSASKKPAKGKKLFSYSPQRVKNALDAIRSGTPVLQASRTFGVPRTTLRRKIKGSAPETSGHVGPLPVLGSYVEKKLSDWLIETSRMGFPIDKECLLHSVKQLVEAENLQTPFKNNLPGRRWFESFMKRHPELSQKKAEYLSKTRAAVSEDSIRKWFANLETLLGENMQILQHPRRIFNMDETAVFRAPKGGLVLGEKGKALYDVSSASDKEAITTLFTVNAEGQIAPPLTLYKYVRLPKSCIDAAPPGWGIGRTENGWMDSASFYEYIANIFHPYLLEKEIPLPVIVFLDGHVSHLSYHLSQFCREHNIIVCCLPPNTTHILQPLDVAFFAPLKQQWKKFVKFWRLQHDGEDIQKFEVPNALSQIIAKPKFADTIKAGFRTCGLYPHDPNAVDYTKCVQRKPVEEAKTTEEEIIVGNQTSDEHLPLRYLERNIPIDILREFESTFASNTDWVGDVQYTALYETWFRIRQESSGRILQEDPNLQDNREHSIDVEASAAETFNCDSIEFEFPELQSVLDGLEQEILFIGDVEEGPLDKTDENQNLLTAMAGNEAINLPSTSAAKENLQKATEQTNDAANSTSCEGNNITVTKSMDETLQKVLIYPDPKPAKKRQYKREQLPCVVTSEKWAEIMAAKENDKREKAEKTMARKARGLKETNETEENIHEEAMQDSTTEAGVPPKKSKPARKVIQKPPPPAKKPTEKPPPSTRKRTTRAKANEA